MKRGVAQVHNPWKCAFVRRIIWTSQEEYKIKRTPKKLQGEVRNRLKVTEKQSGL